MTAEERKTISKAWITLAQVYGKEISEASMRMMIDAISDLNFVDVMRALGEWTKTSKAGRHPFPAEVRDLANPKLSIESEAQMAAARVYEAITRFGYCNGKEAKVFIGSLGWEAVKRFGGWQVVCEIVGVSYDKSTFLAHVRNQIKAEIETRNTSPSNFLQLEITPRPDRRESLVHPNTVSEPKIIPNDLLNSMLKVKTMP